MGIVEAGYCTSCRCIARVVRVSNVRSVTGWGRPDAPSQPR